MTKYILHGGGESKASDDNKIFFQEMLKGFSSVSILCVYFARDKRLNVWDWNKMFDDDKRQISSACPNVKITFTQAIDKISTFVEQIKKSDIIYIRGGITQVLLEYLTGIPNLQNIWNNKIIVGCSAGALVLSRYYYDGDTGTYNKGLNLLPIKTICHWGEDRFDKLKGLKKFGEKVEVFTIPEQKFFIIER